MDKTKKYFAPIFAPLLDILFPAICIGCGKNVNGGETVCFSCFKDIPLNASLFCGQCGARLPENEKICHYDFPYILGAASSYKNEIARGLILELKFRFVKSAAEPLAGLMSAYAENLRFTEGDWLVVPMPLGKGRFRKRGFNQAALISKIFSEKFSLETEEKSFVRQRETKPQSEIKTAAERLRNTANCFLAAAPEKFAGRDIILIDDVTTSGATFFEAAVALKKAGARKIIALAAARG